jgi:small subunit ribosomal protein S29
MLRSLTRTAATNHHSWRNNFTPTISSLSFSSKSPSKPIPTSKTPASYTAATADVFFDEQERLRNLNADEKNPSLNVGPNGRPLFTSASSLSKLTNNDICTYFKLTYTLFFSFFALFTIAAFSRTGCVCRQCSGILKF